MRFQKKIHVWFWFDIVESFCKNERTCVSKREYHFFYERQCDFQKFSNSIVNEICIYQTQTCIYNDFSRNDHNFCNSKNARIAYFNKKLNSKTKTFITTKKSRIFVFKHRKQKFIWFFLSFVAQIDNVTFEIFWLYKLKKRNWKIQLFTTRTRNIVIINNYFNNEIKNLLLNNQ